MNRRTPILILALLVSSCMCWPPIPNASQHRRPARKAHYDSVADRTSQRPAPTSLPWECDVDLVADTMSCDPQFDVDVRDGMGRVAVDVPDGHALLLHLDICEPSGWVLNVGDSPTNDGGGGDYGSTSNDAELQLRDTSLGVIANDYALDDPTRRNTVEQFLLPRACQPVTARIADGEISISGELGRHDFRGRTLLRLNPERDDEGYSDNRWFVGLNRVVDSTRRSGHGVQFARLWVVAPEHIE